MTLRPGSATVHDKLIAIDKTKLKTSTFLRNSKSFSDKPHSSNVRTTKMVHFGTIILDLRLKLPIGAHIASQILARG